MTDSQKSPDLREMISYIDAESAKKKASKQMRSADALETAFRAHTAGETNFTRRMAINIGDFLGLTPMAVVWKLEKRGLIKSGSWEWFKSNGGVTKIHIAEARADRVPQ